MSTKHELERMKQGWEKHGISRRFSSVHHFSSNKFATKPSGLKGFYNWCKDRDILDENYQTVKRANRVIALIEDGKSIDAAISHAWAEFPICKR
jgi:hypothetical protein